MKEWRSTEKKPSYIREEFGYDGNAWKYVRNAFGDKGSLKSTEKLEINRDIAKIARIHSHSQPAMGISGRSAGFPSQFPPREINVASMYGVNTHMQRVCFDCGSPNHLKKHCQNGTPYQRANFQNEGHSWTINNGQHPWSGNIGQHPWTINNGQRDGRGRGRGRESFRGGRWGGGRF